MVKANPSRLSFRAIEVFVAVIEEGSILKAAERLGASASSVSLQLSNLEQILDARLIERSARKFELTAAGETFAPHARSILDQVTNAKVEIASTSHAPRMDLRLAVIEDFDEHILPAWLNTIRHQYPQSKFKIHSGASHENHASLSSRGVDIIVAADTTSNIDWVEEITVFNDPFIMVSASERFSNASIDDLLEVPFIRYSQEQIIGRQIEAQLRRSKIKLDNAFECSTNQALNALVKQFDGWAITTASAFLGSQNQTSSSSLIARPLPIASFSRTISVYSRRDTLGEISDNIAASLKECLTELLLPKISDELPFLSDVSVMMHK